MAEPVSLVMVGVGGMGAAYLEALLARADEGLFRITGAVDPQPNRCKQYVEMRAMGVPCFISLQDFYRNRKADLAIISSPIQMHMPQTSFALSKGTHVLCEKPAAGTIQEVRAALEAERAASRWVAVGYQWSFSSAVQKLKGDIRSGLLGKARRFKCLYLWPRDEGYYKRNDWAGKRRDAEGAWVLDSPVQNAMAHDLHNMFYVLGKEKETSARPAEVEAELYRANAIENFDTAAARVRTEEGVEILFLVSHVSEEDRGPVLAYEFDKGVVRCESRTSGLWAEFPDGTRKDYGVPDAEPMNKMWRSIAGVREPEARPLCGLEAASSQTLCMNGIQDSMPEVRDFPAERVRVVDGPGAQGLAATTPGGGRRRVVEGLDEAMAACYEAWKLPSEMGVGWSARGGKVDLTSYDSFPSK
jgi:predicted dehydrogenase